MPGLNSVLSGTLGSVLGRGGYIPVYPFMGTVKAIAFADCHLKVLSPAPLQ
jgi:hypothetical protein